MNVPPLIYFNDLPQLRHLAPDGGCLVKHFLLGQVISNRAWQCWQ
jgi:hypothetical protein